MMLRGNRMDQNTSASRTQLVRLQGGREAHCRSPGLPCRPVGHRLRPHDVHGGGEGLVPDPSARGGLLQQSKSQLPLLDGGPGLCWVWINLVPKIPG